MRQTIAIMRIISWCSLACGIIFSSCSALQAQRRAYLYDNIYSMGGTVVYQIESTDFFSENLSNNIASSRGGLNLFMEGPVYNSNLGIFKIGLNFARATNKGKVFNSDKYFLDGFNIFSLLFRKTRLPLFVYYARNHGKYQRELFSDFSDRSEMLLFRGIYRMSRKDEFSFYLSRYTADYTNASFAPKDNSAGILWNHKFKKIEVVKGARTLIKEQGKSQIWLGYNYYNRNLSYVGGTYPLANFRQIYTSSNEKLHHVFINSYNEFRAFQLFSQFNYLTNTSDNLYFARVSSSFPILRKTRSELSVSYSLNNLMDSSNTFLDTQWRTYTGRKGLLSYISSSVYYTIRDSSSNSYQNKFNYFFGNINIQLDISPKLKGNSYAYASSSRISALADETQRYSAYGAGINLIYALNPKIDLYFDYDASAGTVVTGESSLINSVGIGMNYRMSNKLGMALIYSQQFSASNSDYNGYLFRAYFNGSLTRNISYLSMNQYMKSNTFLVYRATIPTQFSSFNQLNMRINRRIAVFSGVNYYSYDASQYTLQSLFAYTGSSLYMFRYLSASFSGFYGNSKPEVGKNFGYDVAINFSYAKFILSTGYRYLKNQRNDFTVFGNKGYYIRISRSFDLQWL